MPVQLHGLGSENDKQFHPQRHIDTAAAYANEREVGEGIRRSGLDRADVFIESNSMATHLDDLGKATSVVPPVNQIEVHPYFSQPEVRAANRRLGILAQRGGPEPEAVTLETFGRDIPEA